MLEYNIANKTPVAQVAQEYLAERQQDLEKFLENREAAIKKAGKKGDEVKEKNPLYEELY